MGAQNGQRQHMERNGGRGRANAQGQRVAQNAVQSIIVHQPQEALINYSSCEEYTLSLQNLRMLFGEILPTERYLKQVAAASNSVEIALISIINSNNVRNPYRLIMRKADFYIIGYERENRLYFTNDTFNFEGNDITYRNFYRDNRQGREIIRRLNNVTVATDSLSFSSQYCNDEKTRSSVFRNIFNTGLNVNESLPTTKNLLDYFAVSVAEAMRFNLVESQIKKLTNTKYYRSIAYPQPDPSIDDDQTLAIHLINQWSDISQDFHEGKTSLRVLKNNGGNYFTPYASDLISIIKRA